METSHSPLDILAEQLRHLKNKLYDYTVSHTQPAKAIYLPERNYNILKAYTNNLPMVFEGIPIFENRELGETKIL